MFFTSTAGGGKEEDNKNKRDGEMLSLIPFQPFRNAISKL
jgi:hypothetical protein